jgi:hypothetical protein
MKASFFPYALIAVSVATFAISNPGKLLSLTILMACIWLCYLEALLDVHDVIVVRTVCLVSILNGTLEWPRKLTHISRSRLHVY